LNTEASAVLVDELDARGPECRRANSQDHDFSGRNWVRFARSEHFELVNCVFDLILALHVAVDRAVSANKAGSNLLL
jgi:hypothetical protein